MDFSKSLRAGAGGWARTDYRRVTVSARHTLLPLGSVARIVMRFVPVNRGIGPAENGVPSAVPCPPICVDQVTVTVPELSAAVPRTVMAADVVVMVALAG